MYTSACLKNVIVNLRKRNKLLTILTVPCDTKGLKEQAKNRPIKDVVLSGNEIESDVINVGIFLDNRFSQPQEMV